VTGDRWKKKEVSECLSEEGTRDEGVGGRDKSRQPTAEKMSEVPE